MVNKKTGIFILFHFCFVTAIIILYAYLMYPYELGIRWQQDNLKELYNAFEEYNAEHGHFPQNLSALHQDSEGWFFFDNKKLDHFNISDVNSLEYEIRQGKPVLTDLGRDRKKGGIDSDLDIVYPPEYQKPISFFSFMMAGAFFRALGFGFILAAAISACLYGIWQKRLTSGKPSLDASIALSVGFLLFEGFLAFLIMVAHIYPHH